jgi:hypothetical protein
MKWYMPSWNGDLRLEADAKDSGKTLLWIEKPTDHELKVLAKLRDVLFAAGHLKDKIDPKDFSRSFFAKKKSIVIDAPIATVGPLAAKLMKPGEAVLTAVTFKDGKVLTCTGTGSELVELAGAAAEAAEKAPEKEKPAAAATVKRPTPSCPQCVPGSIEPAREVLLAFLSEEEHEQWAVSRTLTITGGLSGHRYLLAHRHTDAARRVGRICYDLDAECVVHFHDRSVPPEEEVLAAKLILEHQEPWLRNEATMLGMQGHALVFKNPFGGGLDGVPDAKFTSAIGNAVLRAL